MPGTWKLNQAKSKLSSGAAKNNTVVYELAGDGIKCTIDGEDSQGKPLHVEWTGKFDGKDYALSGDAEGDMGPTRKSTSRRWTELPKKMGTSRIAVAPDGKTRSVTTNMSGSGGKKEHSIAFYDKQ
jgi:hypothetical protein